MAAHASPATATCKGLAMKRTADKRRNLHGLPHPHIMVVIVLGLILLIAALVLVTIALEED